MPNITLPDGSQRSYDQPVTPATIAADIGPGLAKAALLAVVDDAEWDLTRPIENDARLSLVTAKDEQALALLRHDCAHVMAEAVLELFPETQVTIGPAIENGFYYDFIVKRPLAKMILPPLKSGCMILLTVTSQSSAMSGRAMKRWLSIKRIMSLSK